MKTEPKRALMVIDVQNEYFDGKLPIEFPPSSDSLANILRAMNAAEAAGMPVIVVENLLEGDHPVFARGSHGAALHPAIAEKMRSRLITKSFPSGFAGTGLKEWLKERGIDTVTIVGYMTQMCDLSAAIHAIHLGFAVEFLSDATGTIPLANRAGYASAQDIHRVVCVVLQSRFGAVMSTDEWVALLEKGGGAERDTILGSLQKAREFSGSAR
ncbi:MAG: cysteine hydrolase [Nitrospinae bacterium]|nr:cysteine hydrolase [Nitrospinota bacterium]